MPTPSIHIPTHIDTTRVSHSAWAQSEIDWNDLARFTVLEEAIMACPDQYFVTLTSRRTLTSGALTAEVGKVLHKVNAKLFGTHYSRHKRVRLATYAVQERSYADGLHAHLLIGVPEGSLLLKANPCRERAGDLVISEWLRADPETRRAVGQDSQEIYNFSGVSSYVRKGVRSQQAIDNVDLHNCSLPYMSSALS